MQNTTENRPVICIALGDPAGVGPEVCVRTAAEPEVKRVCRLVIVGSPAIVRRAAELTKTPLTVTVVESIERLPESDAEIMVYEPEPLDLGDCPYGVSSASNGRAQLSWIRAATTLASSGRAQAVVMGPVDSTALKLSGEVSDIDSLQPEGTYMFRLGQRLRVVPISEHFRLLDAIRLATAERIFQVIQLVHENLTRWGLQNPRIGVAGINPHAMFEEDRREVAPAVAKAKSIGIDVSGPVSPDSVFRQAIEGRYDAVVSMYHDQGQVALKTADFEGACTVYLGLPYPMLNVPHGSAYDIAGKGVAQHKSMLAAVLTAAGLINKTLLT